MRISALRQAVHHVKLFRRALLVLVAGGIALASLASVLLWGAPVTQAQSGLTAPANFKAVNGPNAGEAILSWDAVSGAAYYRVGWIAQDAAFRAIAEKTDFFNDYVFADVSGTTTYTVTGLQPGKKYYFNVASLSERFGTTASEDVVTLALNEDGSSCPTPAPAPTPGPGGTPTPPAGGTATPTPPPQVTGGDYDADNDGLIEIRNLQQLDAMRYDLDGDGAIGNAAYEAAFPGAAANMGCPSSGCLGYELVTDLDYGTELSAEGWAPIVGFNTVFDGNGHTISNLHINRSSTTNVGLFAQVWSGAVIRQVGLVSINVNGGSRVGGLAGQSAGTIEDSYVTGVVTGDTTVGGLVGWLRSEGNITRSYASSTLTATGAYVGGLVGYNSGGVIASYAAGRVVARGFEKDLHTGGLIGYNWGTVTASYATGHVSSVHWIRFTDRSDNHVGGLVGYNNGDIGASYATSSVVGRTGTGADLHAGGLAGYNSGTIIASYAIGPIAASVSAGDNHRGGLIGYNAGRVSHSYWDTQSSLSRGSGGIGLTTAELQSPTSATGIYAAWNPHWWDFGTSEQYPVLKVEGLSVALQRGVAEPGTAAPASTDREALVDLYNATGGDNWKNIPDNEKWLIHDHNSPISNWHGVSTNGEAHVTQLSFQDKGLRGQLPSALGNLENLTYLNLSHNDLGGGTENEDDLTWLVNLENLTHLDLSNNRRGGILGSYRNALGLKGQFPLALAGNENLTYVNLSNNLFENDLDELLEAFSQRGHDSEFYLNVQHNTWVTSGATKGLASWVGDLVVTEDEYAEHELLAVHTFYSATKGDIDDIKQHKDIVKNILKDKNGQAVFGIAKLLCAENKNCQALSGQISSMRALYKQAKGIRGATALVTLYYDATILSNPLIEDLMVSAVVGWINGWTTDQILDHYLSRLPHYEKGKEAAFNLGYFNSCYPNAQDQQWCDVCKPFEEDNEDELKSQRPSWFTACLCTIPAGFHEFPYACPSAGDVTNFGD